MHSIAVEHGRTGRQAARGLATRQKMGSRQRHVTLGTKAATNVAQLKAAAWSPPCMAYCWAAGRLLRTTVRWAFSASPSNSGVGHDNGTCHPTKHTNTRTQTPQRSAKKMLCDRCECMGACVQHNIDATHMNITGIKTWFVLKHLQKHRLSHGREALKRCPN